MNGEITLRNLISWVKQNFPAKIIDEVSGAEVEVGKNKELQEKLLWFKWQMEGIIKFIKEREKYYDFRLSKFMGKKILGEEDDQI